jgi:hypothetical protein
LRSLAAGRRAEVDDGFAFDGAQQGGRDCRGGVLDPPGTFGVAGEIFDAAAGHAAERAGGEQSGVELFRPGFGVAFHANVERRFDAVRLGDRTGSLFAVGRNPIVPRPRRRVQAFGVERG